MRKALVATAALALAVLLSIQCGEGDASGAASGTGAPAAGGATVDTTPDSPLLRDGRVVELIYDCARDDHYDRDVADTIPILIEKLRAGYPDPLHRSKTELSNLGELAMPELTRLVDATINDPYAAAHLQNALDVAMASEAEGARELLLRALRDPRDTVRMQAIRGLTLGHAQPEDYDALRSFVDFGGLHQRKAAADALYAADPERAALEYVEWFATGRYESFWQTVMMSVAEVESAAVSTRVAEAWDGELPTLVRAPAAGALVRGGDEAGLAWLRDELASDDNARRTLAAQVLLVIGLGEELLGVLDRDADPTLRAIVAGHLASFDWTPAMGEAFVRALSDPEPGVVATALSALVDHGHAAGVDRALAFLGGSREELEMAVGALRGNVEDDPELAGRAFARLQKRWEDESHLPYSAKLGTLQALGLVASRSSVEFLGELASEVDGVEIDRLRGHEWIVMQIANSGRSGFDWLVARHAEETDPHRRIDLLWCIAGARDAAAREYLLAVTEDETVDPYERLYAASRVVQIGPSSDVAPRLKRVCLRIEEPRVRRAMQCLLWTWY